MKNSHEFYLIVAPGLEELALKELRIKSLYFVAEDGQALAETPEILEVGSGGLLLRSSLMFGLQLNFFMRLASRVLLRLGRFHVKEFHRLEAELKKLKPEVMKYCEGPFEAKVSCSRSVLNHEKRVQETLGRVLPLVVSASEKSGMTAQEIGQLPFCQKIYLRIDQNECDLSLDTSGEHLHRRGWRQQHSGAPLRETLAAALVRLLCQGHSPTYLSQVCLMDPFIGSGTLLREFAERDQPLLSPRSFLRWKAIPKLLKSEHFSSNILKSSLPEESVTASSPESGSLVGFDFDSEALRLSEQHLRSLVPQLIPSLQLIDWNWAGGLPRDPFSAELMNSKPASSAPKWAVLNPPYGDRKEQNFNLKQMLEDWTEAFQIERLAIALPVRQDQIMSPVKWTVLQRLETSNGGIPVSLTVWERKQSG